MRPKTEYGTGDLAVILGVSQQTAIRMFDRGEFRGHRVPDSRFRRVFHVDLVEFFARSPDYEPADAEWAMHAESRYPFNQGRKLSWVHDGNTVYTTGDVAHILNVSDSLVRRWMDSRLLPGFKLVGEGTRERRVRKSDLLEFCLLHGLFVEREPHPLALEQNAAEVVDRTVAENRP